MWKRYHLIGVNSYEGLNIEVNKMIKKGWQPIGGIATSYNKENDWTDYYQAMVSTTSERDEELKKAFFGSKL